jgi:hypothetical protein
MGVSAPTDPKASSSSSASASVLPFSVLAEQAVVDCAWPLGNQVDIVGGVVVAAVN